MNKIYCFSLYCEGKGLTKSQVFVTIRETEEAARFHADKKNKTDFPLEQGWYNHQISMIEIPKETIIQLAKEYVNEKVYI